MRLLDVKNILKQIENKIFLLLFREHCFETADGCNHTACAVAQLPRHARRLI